MGGGGPVEGTLAGGWHGSKGRGEKEERQWHEERATTCISAFLFNKTDGCQLLIGKSHLRRKTHQLPSTSELQSEDVGICCMRRKTCPNTTAV